MYEWIGKITANEKLLRRLAFVSGMLPRPILYLLCQWVGMLLHAVAGKKIKSRINGNMQDLLGGKYESVRKASARKYLINVVVTLYEILIDVYRLERNPNERFDVIGEQALQDVLQQGKGAIIHTPHLGNFFYYYWYLSRRYNCLTIATAGSKELRPIYLKFQDMGCRGLDYDHTPPLTLLRTLKKHLAQGGVVFILGDFWRQAFPLAHFFGRLTRTPEGAAMLAIENQVPVIPFHGYRERSFRHRMVFGQPIWLHEMYQREQRAEANDFLNQQMESAIRLCPNQWFYWFNADERFDMQPNSGSTRKAG